MPRADGPAEESWWTLPTEERDAAYLMWNLEGVAMREREAGWMRQGQVDARVPRMVGPAHEGQMMLEDAR